VRRIVLIVAGALSFVWLIVVPIFERLGPPNMVRAFRRSTMPFFEPWAGVVPGFGVVETVGRRSGRPRRTPVGGRLSGNTFWLVSGLGRDANYVRNVEADPRVRVKAHGRWRSGVAHLCPEDDTWKRMFWANPINGLFVWLAGGDHLTIRIDLDR
jgi:deazaflavin-dependent oxidoreductase (nitroreductase family)